MTQTIPQQTQQTTLPSQQPVEDEKVEISYTDPTAQFIDEMKVRLGLVTDDELRGEE